MNITQRTEYGINRNGEGFGPKVTQHCEGMTRRDMRAFLKGTKDFHPGLFQGIQRPIMAWEKDFQGEDENREWGIYFARYDRLNRGRIHREGMTKAQAETWVEDWKNNGGNVSIFQVVSRQLMPWTAD